MKTKSRKATVASSRRLPLLAGASFGALVALSAGAAMAQDAAAAQATAKDDSTLVIVTGFRGSLQSAISAKRKEDSIVDVIKSEDIAQFPDLNLAEALQRIPGVAIDRDGGEGRTITVRGLNSDFTRVRLDGLEALATTGGKDSSGGANRGRGFDFNVFAADLFNSVTVRKSMTAETEEGSLGATVDLQTARPFDYKGFTMAMGGEVGYNDLSKDNSPRGQFLISNRWADGKLGALLSVSYGTRKVEEEGPNTTRWENAYSSGTAGRFASYSSDGGKTFTAIPTSGALTGEAANISNALHPRIPRYSRFLTDQKRLGVTGSFQMRPNPNTLLTLDGMYAKFDANREEYEIEAISFSRSGQGLPKSSVYNYDINDQGTMDKASFNNVDIRTEHRFDALSTTFQQLNLTWEQRFSDKFSMTALIGKSKSYQDTPEQTTFTFDAYDIQGYSYDFTDDRHPVFDYGHNGNGCTIDQACYWTYTGSTAAGGSSSAAKGDASLIRIRPQNVDNEFATAKVDFKYDLNDSLTLKAGASTKAYDFSSVEYGRYTSKTGTRDEAASTVWASGITSAINGDIAKYGETVSVAGNTYLIPNLDLIRSTFNYDCRCTNSYGTFTVDTDNSSSRGNNNVVAERDKSAYVQLDFRSTLMNMPVRGNVGVRQVETRESATGILNTAPITVDRDYKDTLPAMNVSVQPMDNVYIRFAAAKTMSRPTLQSLTPGGSISTGGLTLKNGNPYLDPIRANTADLSLEWYPDKESLFSVGLFTKDIKSYIQTQVQSLPFSALGLDSSLLDGTSLTQNSVFVVTQPINTPGGKLQGFEISLQRPFSFLPGLLRHTGGIVNYTHVESKINYVVASNATSVTYRRDDLLGLSPQSWNATLYYDDGKLSARVAVAHREGYLSLLNPGSSADFQGKNGTTNVDMQATYKVNAHLTFVLEGINLTDQYDDKYDAYNTAQGNTADNIMLDYSHSGRQYYMGFRYKY